MYSYEHDFLPQPRIPPRPRKILNSTNKTRAMVYFELTEKPAMNQQTTRDFQRFKKGREG